MTAIDGDRLLDGLRTLRTFGAHGTGVVRPTFSDQDMAARAWLRDRMAAAGLEATIDGVGNVFGRSRTPGPGAGARFAFGHTARGWLARRCDGRDVRDRGRPRARGRPGDGRPRGRCRRVVRRGGHLHELSRRQGLRRRGRHCGAGSGERRRRIGRRGAGAGRVDRRATRTVRSRAARGIPRGPHRAGPVPRGVGAADRRRHLDRRDPRRDRHVHRRTEPRRHHPDGPTQGRRGRDVPFRSPRAAASG